MKSDPSPAKPQTSVLTDYKLYYEELPKQIPNRFSLKSRRLQRRSRSAS